MLNNISNSTPVDTNYNNSPVQGAAPANTANNNQTFPTDGFSPSNNYSTLNAGTNSYPVSQLIAEDTATAGKFTKFFMGNSSSLLRVGSNWLGKVVLNAIAGDIPFITSSANAARISNNVTLWVGRADLVRTGMNPIQAMVLQDAGIKNATDLSRITNLSDQAVLAQLANAAGANRGMNVGITPNNVSTWVASSQQLSKYF